MGEGPRGAAEADDDALVARLCEQLITQLRAGAPPTQQPAVMACLEARSPLLLGGLVYCIKPLSHMTVLWHLLNTSPVQLGG